MHSVQGSLFAPAGSVGRRHHHQHGALLVLPPRLRRARRETCPAAGPALPSRSAKVVRDILTDACRGRQVEVERVEPIVENLIQSVMPNSGALASPGRVKQQDNYTCRHSVNVGLLLIPRGNAGAPGKRTHWRGNGGIPARFAASHGSYGASPHCTDRRATPRNTRQPAACEAGLFENHHPRPLQRR